MRTELDLMEPQDDLNMGFSGQASESKDIPPLEAAQHRFWAVHVATFIAHTVAFLADSDVYEHEAVHPGS